MGNPCKGWLVVLIAGIWLSACAAPPSPPALSTTTLPAAVTDSPVVTPATATFTLSLTPTRTSSPTEPATETPTEGPSLTPRVFHYVFPLQPASAAGFIEGTKAHGYPATDIFAAPGTRFVAVTDGVVDFVSSEDTWDPAVDEPASRGGLAVAIIGLDGVRYYGSHLSAVAAGIRVGREVEAGQLLGWVGNSGDARNTLSHIHFGISRPTTPDDWKARRGEVDPFPFLEAWRDKHDVTPPLP